MQISKCAHAALGLALLGTVSCVGAPQGGSSAPSAGAAGGGNAASTPATAGAPAAAGKIVVWDGDNKSAGKGWCEKKADCTIDADPKGGKTGVGLKWTDKGTEWLGMGWNWYGWWPDTAGDNINGKANLHFSIKIDAKSPKEAPDLNSMTVHLVCSCKGKKDDDRSTADAKLAEHAKDLAADGKWHDVTIPTDILYKDKGAKFDKGFAWELDMGTWSQDAKEFTVYLDDIYFD